MATQSAQRNWPRLMLHAESIDFLAPGGERLSLTATLPPSFAAVLQAQKEPGGREGGGAGERHEIPTGRNE